MVIGKLIYAPKRVCRMYNLVSPTVLGGNGSGSTPAAPALSLTTSL